MGTGFLAILLLSGCTAAPDKVQQALEAGESTPAAATEVTVYFGSPAGDRLVPVKRPVPDGKEPYVAALEALVSGPSEQESLQAVLPEGTKVQQFTVLEGTVHLNLSREFGERYPTDAAKERLALYALTNTLTEFQNVKTVRIYVDMKPFESFVDNGLQPELRRREDLIQTKG